jgi:hypothetical protein
MNISLLKVLVERNIIGVRTEIDARYRGRDIAGNPLVTVVGTFLILDISQTDSGFTFTCADTIDGKRRLIQGESIVGVDGMDPIRLAANYELDENGERVKVGKRRGRKPRSAIQRMVA